MFIKKFLTIIFVSCLLLFIAHPILAQFNPNNIISDYDLTNYNSMYMGQIQNFLTSKNSYLATYVDPAIRITTAQAIYDTAHLHRINPKYILVLLQKEQSLVEGDTPNQNQLDWATGYGICDSCKKTDTKVQKYKGLINQIDWGAGGTRYYFDNADKLKFKVTNTYNIDGQKVTMTNDATRALYTYTPHIHGNQNFYNIWQKWFSSSFLDGSLLQNTEDGGIYLIRDNKKFPFLSKSAFLSRYNSFDKVIPANPIDLNKYPTGQAIQYPNYSLLQISTGGIYLLDDDTLHPIISKKIFKLLGFNPEEIIPVNSTDIFFYKVGKPINDKSAYPTGAILQDKTSGGRYFVQNGEKKPILAPELIKLYYKYNKIIIVTTDELNNYVTVDPVKLKDGELVTAPDNSIVYVIANGQKHPFTSAATFLSLGYKWKNVISMPNKIINLQPTGTAITQNI